MLGIFYGMLIVSLVLLTLFRRHEVQEDHEQEAPAKSDNDG